jgi:hypothetical protein
MKQMQVLLSLVFLVVLVSSHFLVCVEASLMWSQTFGGDGMDFCNSMLQAVDGGFVLVGSTHSFETDGVWLVKTDEGGNIQWNKTVDKTYSCIQTLDGGFAFVGTDSAPVEGYLPVGGMPRGFWSFVWLAKTDEYGNIQWNQTYDAEKGYFNGVSVTQTSDGGYALLGNSFSSFGDYGDFVLIKTDSQGNKEWIQFYNSSEPDSASNLIQTLDGGFAFIRRIFTSTNGFVGSWVVKTDGAGNVEWNQTYSDLGSSNVISFIQLSDESFVLVGNAPCFANRMSGFYLTKLDAKGTPQWTKIYSTQSRERFHPYMIQTSDGGLALACHSVDSGPNSPAEYSFLLIKTDDAGTILWSQSFSGELLMGNPCVIQTVDGDYVLSGSKASSQSGDCDYWLLKAQPPRNPETESPLVLSDFFPEPNSMDVALDTTVSVSFDVSPELVELSISPEVEVNEKTTETAGFFGETHTFHFDDWLEPSTDYTVSVTYGPSNTARTWSFTTTDQIPEPPPTEKDDPHDLTPYLLVLTVIVIISVIVVGLYLSKTKKS